jgi:2-polyprenyl-3-methyl-5-hydroxy-6-metoxy-1,4-benzoquinol methylase
MEQIQACPICGNAAYNPFLECKDHSVSRETFTIVQCNDCGFRFTNPRPEEDRIGEYYKSEDYVSHSNTSKGLINTAYQFVRKYTLRRKLALISSLVTKGRLLDIGCGTGEFLAVCKEAGWNVSGIEPSKEAREQAIQNHQLEVHNEDKLSEYANESFDMITMWHVLEHVPKLQERIRDIKRLLKKGGILVVAVPNCASGDALHYKEYWAAYDVPRHLYHFRPNDIQKVFEEKEMKVVDMLPMKFDSFYVSMLSEKYLHGKQRIFHALWRGLLSNLSASRKGTTYSSQIYIIKK